MLRGFIIDEIAECTSHTLQANDKYDDAGMAVLAGTFAWHHEAAEIAQSLSLDSGRHQRDDTSFWSTLCADFTSRGRSAESSIGDGYRKVVEYLKLIDGCCYGTEK